jgi:hypothetical protein
VIGEMLGASDLLDPCLDVFLRLAGDLREFTSELFEALFMEA